MESESKIKMSFFCHISTSVKAPLGKSNVDYKNNY